MSETSCIVDFVVEIPNGSFVKYEYDKDLKMLRVDRILHTCMAYPGNYGYIPNTLANDGDAIDVLMLGDFKVLPMTLIKVKIIGVLRMTDEKGEDEKLIAVPHSSIDPTYERWNDIHDVPKHVLIKIKHFFEHYKDTEPDKWVKVDSFENRTIAQELYESAKKNTVLVKVKKTEKTKKTEDKVSTDFTKYSSYHHHSGYRGNADDDFCGNG